VEGPVGGVETDPLPEVVHEPFVDLFFDWAQVRVDVVVGYGFSAGELGYDAPELGEGERVGWVLGLRGLWLLVGCIVVVV